MRLTVKISDMKFSSNIDDIIITHALGSCIAVIIYDPVLKIGALLHALLPDSKQYTVDKNFNPFKYVDTGIPILFKTLLEFGSKRKNIITKVAGGSLILKSNSMFNTGTKNFTMARKIFWRNNILIKAEDVGGNSSRTVELHISTGDVIISSQKKKYFL